MFFRHLLVIPHVIVLALWGIAAYLAWIVNWFATLFAGRSPEGLHNFLAGFLRYATQVSAYQYLLANPYPSFGGGQGYPVDLEVAPPEPQSRLLTFFRAFAAIPALIISYLLLALLGIIAIIGWFTGVFAAKMPEGMEDLGTMCLRYSTQTQAYLMLLTDRYPSFSTGSTERATTTPA